MKIAKIILFMVLLGFSFTNCSTTLGLSTYGVTDGSLFTNVILNKDVSTSADMSLKNGQACATSFLGAFAFGDAGAKNAATNGGIKVIRSVDFKYSSVFRGILFAQVCTIVRGE